MPTSTRNQIEGTVSGIIRGQVLSEVDAETASGLVVSVVTTRSVDEMALKVGDKVLLLVEATDVGLHKSDREEGRRTRWPGP